MYYFNLQDGDTVVDSDGTDLPDVGAARIHATGVARELTANGGRCAHIQPRALCHRRGRSGGRASSKAEPPPPSAWRLERVRLELNAKALSEMIAGRRAIVPSLPNARGNVAVAKLSTAKILISPATNFGRVQ
jgi:hypothetical protein